MNLTAIPGGTQNKFLHRPIPNPTRKTNEYIALRDYGKYICFIF